MNTIVILVPTHVSDHREQILICQNAIKAHFGAKYTENNINNLPITLVNTDIEPSDIDVIKKDLHEDVQIILIENVDEIKHYIHQYNNQ